MPLVSSGVEHGNLRELALQKMKEQDLVCLDIRMPEVGMKQIHAAVVLDQVELVRRDYVANVDGRFSELRRSPTGYSHWLASFTQTILRRLVTAPQKYRAVRFADCTCTDLP